MVNDTKYQAGKPAGKSTWTKIDPQYFIICMVEMIQRLIRYRVPDVHPNPSVGTHTAVFMNKIVTWIVITLL
jgi:hypothetical protein